MSISMVGQMAAAARRERPPNKFDGVKVFTATRFHERAHLGDAMTAWLAAHPALELVDIVIVQSSDCTHHCLSATVFYREA